MKPQGFLIAWLACLALMLSAAPAAHAETAHAGRHGHGAQYGTAAAFDAAGRLWAVYRGADGDAQTLLLSVSADQGRSWSPPRRLLKQPEAVAAGGDARPQIAFGAHDEIYVSYTMPIAPPHVGEIRFIRSTDGGRSFSDPVTLNRDRQRVTHGFDSMTVDRDGRIFIAWIDGRDQAAAKARGESYAGSALYYIVSKDAGVSFGAEAKLADHSCECCRIALARDARGRAVALWRHVFAPNVRDHALALLDADGRSAPLERASFDDWRIDACPHHGPALAYAADGARHQIWFNGREDDGGLMYARVQPGSDAIRPQRLGSSTAGHGDVALHGSDVALAWKELDGDGTAIHGKVSHDGGANWRELLLARTGGDSDQPRLVDGPKGIVLVWRTEKEGLRVVPIAAEAR